VVELATNGKSRTRQAAVGGLRPKIPQSEDGTRIEPLVSGRARANEPAADGATRRQKRRYALAVVRVARAVVRVFAGES